MLSLSNAFDKSDMEDFKKRLKIFSIMRVKKLNLYQNLKLMEYQQP